MLGNYYRGSVVLLYGDHDRGRQAWDAYSTLVKRSREGIQFSSKVLLCYLYPKILPAETLAKFDLALNFHPAPLPEYAGYAPYTFGILDGRTSWGVTCHRMIGKVDAGPIVKYSEIPIDMRKVTAEEAREQTMPHLLVLFRSVVERVLRDEPMPIRPNGATPKTKAEFERWRMLSVVEEDRERYRRAFYCPPHKGYLEA